MKKAMLLHRPVQILDSFLHLLVCDVWYRDFGSQAGYESVVQDLQGHQEVVY